MTDPTREEMLAYLTSQYGYDVDEFDLEEAVYWFATNWHGGQWSNLYAALCASAYRPGPLCHGPEPASMAADLYEALEAEYAGQQHAA